MINGPMTNEPMANDLLGFGHWDLVIDHWDLNFAIPIRRRRCRLYRRYALDPGPSHTPGPVLAGDGKSFLFKGLLRQGK